jgi:hypothetical protein
MEQFAGRHCCCCCQICSWTPRPIKYSFLAEREQQGNVFFLPPTCSTCSVSSPPSGNTNHRLAAHRLHARALGDQGGDLGFEVGLGQVGVKCGRMYGDATASSWRRCSAFYCRRRRPWPMATGAGSSNLGRHQNEKGREQRETEMRRPRASFARRHQWRVR